MGFNSGFEGLKITLGGVFLISRWEMKKVSGNIFVLL